MSVSDLRIDNSSLENIKISVIIPTFNSGLWLARCLDSVLNQTHKNIEVLVINDGSTDNSREIIDNYLKKDSRISAVHTSNQGVSAARNEGLKLANGDYIGFVDSDDSIDSTMYETLLTHVIKYNAEISHCSYLDVYPTKNSSSCSDKVSIHDRTTGLIEVLSSRKTNIGLGCKLYKKAVIKGLYLDTTIHNNEDLLFNINAFNRANTSVFIDKPLYHYIHRLNSASTSSLNKFQIEGPLKVSKDIVAMFYNDEILYPYAINKLFIVNVSTYMSFRKVSRKEFLSYKKLIQHNLASYKNELKSNKLLTKKVLFLSRVILYAPSLCYPIFWLYRTFLEK